MLQRFKRRFVDCCVLTVVVCFQFFHQKRREEFVGAVVSVVVGGAAGGSCGWLLCAFGCFSSSVSPAFRVGPCNRRQLFWSPPSMLVFALSPSLCIGTMMAHTCVFLI
jgi:hypothetical protein